MPISDEFEKILEILKLIKLILDFIKELFPDDKAAQAKATNLILTKVFG